MQQRFSVIKSPLTNEVSAKYVQEQGMKWFWLAFGYILYAVTPNVKDSKANQCIVYKSFNTLNRKSTF